MEQRPAPVIKSMKTVVTEHPDGRRDVRVLMPLLELSSAIKANREKRARRRVSADG